MSMTCEPIQKPIRHRDEWHRRRVATYPCVVCATLTFGPNFLSHRLFRPEPFAISQGHHLTHTMPKGRGIKSCDSQLVSMCVRHHDPNSRGSVHFAGNEAAFWAAHGIDPVPIAAWFWRGSQALKPQKKRVAA